MALKVLFSEDPAFAMSTAGVFLSSQPVLHNLVLSILHARIAQGDPGRYWIAIRGNDVVGVVIQSPVTFSATLTPMEPRVAAAVADAIAGAGVALPGVNGEAATAAAFSGQWSERSKSAATPFQGNRLYEFLDAGEAPAIEGDLRQASAKDRSLMIAGPEPSSVKLVRLTTIRNSAWIEGWQPGSYGCGMFAENQSLWPLHESQYMAWSVCQASTRHSKNGSMVTRRHAFMLFPSNWRTLDIGASSIPTWRIPPRIPSTGGLGIGLSLKLSATALSDA